MNSPNTTQRRPRPIFRAFALGFALAALVAYVAMAAWDSIMPGSKSAPIIPTMVTPMPSDLTGDIPPPPPTPTWDSIPSDQSPRRVQKNPLPPAGETQKGEHVFPGSKSIDLRIFGKDGKLELPAK